MAVEFPPPEVLPEQVQAAPAVRPVGLISLGLLLVSIFFSIAGQFTLKSAMNEVGRIGRAQVARPASTISKAVKQPRLWLGLSFFGISAAFYLVVLSRVPLSVAYPLVGVSYIVIVALSRFVLHEHVPALRWSGVAVIALGITLIGLSYGRLSGS